MPTPILLACDLDRTIVPNGSEPLSPGAQEQFADFVAQPHVTLVYATGRHLSSVRDVINEIDLPHPDIIVADVGTSIYWKKNELYLKDILWEAKLYEDWRGLLVDDIQTLLAQTATNTFKLQEPENQGPYKISYYTPEKTDETVLGEIRQVLELHEIKAKTVFSIDAVGHFGYLDILPVSANKELALEYLQHKLSINKEQTIFAGDSGNDLAPLISGCKGIVVNNATAEFKEQVHKEAQEKEVSENIYIAKGEKDGLNGYYTSGVLEGLKHFGLM